MKIGIPKETKTLEERVSVIPSGVYELMQNGHQVYVEKKAGTGSGFTDEMYIKAGADIIEDADTLWQKSDMIIKVKEPVDPEFDRMREGQILFTYLHLAADEKLTKRLLEKKIIGIAYETVQTKDNNLPLLAPMSEVAGRLSVQMGCACLEKKNGGKGLLISGVPGVAPANVTILGGGISGVNAAHLAIGMGARVTIIDINLERLRYLEDIFHSKVVTLMSNQANIEESLYNSDLVIGAVLIPGAKAPKLIKKEYLKNMKKGSVFVDVAIDQGGSAETSVPTTHLEPFYIVDDIVHYCVANMPGAVPRTSTFALTNATLPYVIELANKGVDKALAEKPEIVNGLNVCKGILTNKNVAEAFSMDWQTYLP